MRFALVIIALGGWLVAGCNKQQTDARRRPDSGSRSGTAQAGETASRGVPSAPPTRVGDPPAAASPSPAPVADLADPVPIEAGAVTLTPDNTRIEFVGTHANADPNPRTGRFKSFHGKAELDAEGKTLQSVAVEIDTSSLWTPLPPLTTHLNSPDFLDTREFPKAQFESTKIQAEGMDGRHMITGNLTLLSTTKEIRFPARIVIGDKGLTLIASFNIDRTDFGIDKLQDKVEKTVALNVVIGEKTRPR